MFDAKSILDALVGGGGQRHAPQQQGGGGLGDLLGQVLGGGGQAGRGAPSSGGSGGLEDLLRNLTQGQGAGPAPQGGQSPSGGQGGGFSLEDLLRQATQGGGGQSRNMAPGSGQAAPSQGGGLGDILGKIQEHLGKSGGAPAGQGTGAGGQGGGLTDILGQIFGQATQGAREGAERVGRATGADDAFRNATGGRSPDDLLSQLKDLIANNKVGAGAAMGGLGGLLLGTKAGRSIAVDAAKLGGLVLIGGLAYKAYQNYQQGRPLITGRTDPVAPPPQGSGYEPDAVTNEAATVYIRAMIAAAAADGRIDPQEQQKIIGSLSQAGLNAQAEEFLANELNNPASPEELARHVRTQEEAVQLFTAARIAVDIDTQGEHDFLVKLAANLGLEPDLVQHIDAAAAGSAA